MTHDEWQAQVTELLTYTSWQWLHVRKSIGKGKRWTTATNKTGWPDLWCWSERRHQFAGIELKVAPDCPTQLQLNLLESLGVTGALCVVAYPDDLERLQGLLTGRGDPWPYVGRIRPA